MVCGLCSLLFWRGPGTSAGATRGGLDRLHGKRFVHFQILKHLMPAAKWIRRIRYDHMYSLSFLCIGLDKLLCYLLHWYVNNCDIWSSPNTPQVTFRTLEERLIERLLDLLSKIRSSLRRCADQLRAERPQKLLRMIADMLDEGQLGPSSLYAMVA